MEHAQRVVVSMKDSYSRCLNPYFNGTCSKSVDDNFKDIYDSGLNPYFNGTCSKRRK